ncbi:MAG: hypothetical protein K8T10_02700 [Candidatus Eremiobacteraeota bacterium]|nr:hypothetical protein [Candidatus Eremiobacteraeota bacterium]
MEKAILITSIKKINEHLNKPDKYDRLYFGSEFCTHMIPGVEELVEVFSLCEVLNMEFTLVTPFLDESGIGKVAKLLDFLDYKHLYPEILICDWGMLHYISMNFNNKFPLVLGRILAKQKTGPRIEMIRDVLPSAYKSSMKTHVDIPVFTEFLRSMGVERVDLDIPLQGLDVEMPVDFAISLYYPYTYISTTRRCPIRETGKCDCNEYSFKLSSGNMPVELYARGNTVFFKHERLPRLKKNIKYDRIVFQP